MLTGTPVTFVETSKIIEDENVRLQISPQDSTELTASIKKHGILQALVITAAFLLVAGYRRLKAAKELGLTHVPVMVLEGDVTPARIKTLQLVENIQRVDLPGWDRFNAVRDLQELTGLDQKRLAEELGKSSATICKWLSPAKLSAAWQEALRLDKVSIEACYQASQLEGQAQENMLALKLSGASAKSTSQRIRVKKPAVTRVSCPLPGGAAVQVSGDELDLDSTISALSTVLEAARKAKKDGLDAKTFARVMADKARA